MKCKNCSADVPPQWVHCINTNTCPSCGHELMTTDDLSVLAEVRDAMSQMPNNPEGVASWLISHYKLVRTGSGTPEPTVFHQGHQEVPVHNTNSPVPAPQSDGAALFKQFMDRAGMKVPNAAEIKQRAGNAVPMPMPEGDFDESDYEGDGGDEFTIPAVVSNFVSAAGNPLDSLIQKQRDSRKKMNSGGGSFRR